LKKEKNIKLANFLVAQYDDIKKGRERRKKERKEGRREKRKEGRKEGRKKKGRKESAHTCESITNSMKFGTYLPNEVSVNFSSRHFFTQRCSQHEGNESRA